MQNILKNTQYNNQEDRSDVVSSLKGEIISSRKFDDIKSVDLIDISEFGMTIHNNKTRRNISKRRN